MWIKYVGGGVLMVVAFAYCYQYEHRATAMRDRLAAWIRLLTDIRTHICCFGTPLSDILYRIDKDVLTRLELEGQHGDVQVLLARCRADVGLLPGRCGELLFQLSEELGTVWRQEQVERLDYYIEALATEQTTFWTAMSGAVRLRRTLSLCGALGVILLVW